LSSHESAAKENCTAKRTYAIIGDERFSLGLRSRHGDGIWSGKGAEEPTEYGSYGGQLIAGFLCDKSERDGETMSECLPWLI
jgi:hypothetical protein